MGDKKTGGRRRAGRAAKAAACTGTAGAVRGKACVMYQTTSDPAALSKLTLALRSLFRHTSRDVDVVVLCDEELPALTQAIGAEADWRTIVTPHDMRDCLAGVGITDRGWNRRWPFVTLYRLGIPLHPAFAQYDRVLYMDTDTLVLSDQVNLLLSADLSGCEVRGVPDVSWQRNRVPALYAGDLDPDMAARLRKVLGEDMDVRAYVSAGVLLWNLGAIRTDVQWYKERLASFWAGICKGKFGYLDQDFVNTMLSVRADLCSRFNAIATVFEQSDVIRHYVGGRTTEQLQDAFAAGLV